MKNKRIYLFLILFAVCIVTAFSFLKGSAVSSQKNEIKTNPDTEYQITYELNGGRFEGEYPKTFKISQETTIPNPTMEGSEFIGWFINDNTNVAPVKDYKIPAMTKEDIKLTANWKSSGNMLVDGQTFYSKVSTMTGNKNIKKIMFNSGIPSNISNYSNIDVSQAQDRSIIAYINGDTLYVVSNEEIMANKNSRKMFYNLADITNITFKNFNTSNVKNFSEMFWGCKSLTNLDLSNFNTSNATLTNDMFFDCNSLTSLDLSNFNTSQVTSMVNMFRHCYLLTSIKGLETFDTSKVTAMYNMFHNCYKLSGELTITETTSTEGNVFDYCSTDPSAKFIVKYTNEQAKKVAKQIVDSRVGNGNVFLYEEPSTLVNGQTFNRTIKGMSGFGNVKEIRFIYGTPNGTDISEAKDGSIKAYISGTVLTVSSESEIFANSDCYTMFNSFEKIQKIYFTNFNTSQVINMGRMFWFCKSLTSIDLSNFNTSNVTDVNMLFNNCQSLTRLDLSNFDTSNVTDMSSIFNSCYALKSVDLSNFNTSKATNMGFMFYYCNSLTNLDLSNFNTSNVTNMSLMFAECNSLTSLDLSNFNTSRVTSMESMFSTSYKLSSIKGIENFNTSKVTNMAEMFKSCHLLNGEITIMNPNITEYKNMFQNCSQRTTTSKHKFIVNYTSGCKEVAQNMVNTKSDVSNVDLGTQKSLLNEEIPNNEEPSIPDTIVLTIKDGSSTTTKEILAGELGSLNTPSKEGMIFRGYFYDEEYTKPVSERDVISEDTTIYIKWEEVPQEEILPQEEEILQEENKDESLEVT